RSASKSAEAARDGGASVAVWDDRRASPWPIPVLRVTGSDQRCSTNCFRARQHLLPVDGRVFGRRPAGVVVLAERNVCWAAALFEVIENRVIVLGTILPSAQRTEVRHLQAPFGFDLDDLAFVLVPVPFILALPPNRTSLLPVRYHLRAEHVFLDLLGIGHRGPHLAWWRRNGAFCGRAEIVHVSSLG